MKIKDLEVGSSTTITMVVKSAIARETKAKKPYLALELYDGVDTISGNYWDWLSGNIPAVNSILDVTAQVTEWQGKKQLSIKTLRNNTTRHLSEFMPSSGHDVAQVYKDAYAMMCEINDDMLRDLATALMEELQHQWLTVPGAVGVHHAYTGGTLIHSYSVACIAKAIAKTVPEANEDLCVFGGMFHDIGKLFTYRMDGIAINMTDDGQLYEHIFMGAEFLGNFADAHVDTDDYFNMKKLQLLRHIILSHHGSLEYGSPVVPQCIEACIVNHADGIDATAEQIRAAARKVQSDAKWTERIYTLNNRAQLTPDYVSQIMADYSHGSVLQG
jgi:3'-5' exoribonuclease